MAKLLVVDDDAAIADSLRALLESKGYEALSASDGQAAADLAAREMPDVVLLDLMLPKLPGLEVCRRLKADPRTKGIKIILMTGMGWTAETETASGPDDWVVKPFSTESLLEKIEKALAS